MAHEPPSGGTGTFSVEEYLALEQTTGVKHEYVLGRVYALTGASENQNRIAVNVLAALLPAARASGCRVVGSDQKHIWQTLEAQGGDGVAIGCLGGYELGLDDIYRDLLSA
jgi:Uma2 family endonuclease